MDAVLELRYALDTFYFLITGALVMWMAAGFAMLEAGLVRAKNTAEILTKNIVLYAIACLMFLFIGYQIMYPVGEGNLLFRGFGIGIGNEHVIGDLGSESHSKASDFFFQVVFVATAMSIVSGAVAERMKLWAFLAFAVVMTSFIYPVQGFWNWGGGFLYESFNYKDYAGSGTVHLCGASAALAGVLFLGARKGKYGPDGQINAIPGSNLPLAALGTLILWLGWFGFNGGSELAVASLESANHVARVFVNTNTAAAGGVVSALIVSQVLFGKADLTMALNGGLAGLVAITADPLTPGAGWATLIGVIGGALVVLAIITIDKLRIDDPVGAISVHGVVGTWGIMAVAISQRAVEDGATFGGQLMGVVSIFLWTFIVSSIVWFVLKLVIGIRVSEEEEYEGVDLSECGLEAYPEFTTSK
ncbi:MAG: ammonium transporter [Gammaproteobacteria bacterium]|nr:ammonium transporter [Gammaproteobacteria bacterium]